MRAQMVGLVPLAIPSAFSDRFRDQPEHQAPRAFIPCDGLLIRTVTRSSAVARLNGAAPARGLASGSRTASFRS